MNLTTTLTEKINQKTKPIGALGQLEDIALRIGQIQNTLTPSLNKPTIIIFAGDHGITESGVSAYPQAVTAQMVMNFLSGGAAINVFSRQHGIDLKIVDAGVNHDFSNIPIKIDSTKLTFKPALQLIDKKISNGTQNFLTGEAMTMSQFEQCLTAGKQIVTELGDTGCNTVGFGEMGIGNTSSATMLMSYLCNLSIKECTGRGTGLSNAQLAQKVATLEKANDFHQQRQWDKTNPKAIGACFAGFEIAQMCGAFLQAYEHQMVIMVDGFIATSAFLLANAINPDIKNNAIFCHVSDEYGHQKMLEFLEVSPVLSLTMRLGEGTGCALAYPIIQSAVSFLNDMASFTSAGISQKV